MKYLLVSICLLLMIAPVCRSADTSDNSKACIACHKMVTPGIVADWQKSLHASVSPKEAMVKEETGRRINMAGRSPLETAVGCAECHVGSTSDKHKDTFDHNGFKVHIVVTPSDCAACHSVEKTQYDKNIMSHAHKNLTANPVYQSLAKSINGLQAFDGQQMTSSDPDESTSEDSCLFCHGTEVKVTGTRARTTAMGEMQFPVLSGWPNQGVGRVNPDGTMGSCTPCHTRHEFSIAEARKPETCSECHSGPDVPAYKIYSVSKHGNTYSAKKSDWDFKAVPWTVGEDFTAPTCASCHISQLAAEGGNVIVERTHQMNDRLAWRLFGPIYAHPHPVSPDTSIIRNNAGLPLPTELTGEPASKFLIDAKEQGTRRDNMQKVCKSCHSTGWVDQHFARLENTIKVSNQMTLSATKVLASAWEKGYASGLPQKSDIFDEPIEKMWVEDWLFYGNSTRLASAMAGADYGVFANGRWYQSKNLRKMHEWLNSKQK